MSGLPSPSAEKLRGGYYTPAALVTVLAEWVIQTGRETVLEPSCGDGNFLEAVRPLLKQGARVTAVELFAEEAAKARQRGGRSAEVVDGDVFSWYGQQRVAGTFDAVIGNPPFIRFQHFPERHREAAFSLMVAQGMKPSRLTNAWLPFVVLATDALRDGGRLGFVLPAEVLQVGYAAELREYLVRNYEELTIVTFRRLLFKGIQQETVLLMGIRRKRATARIVFRELHDAGDLSSLNGHHDTFTVDLNHAREKWTQYYLSAPELGLIRELEAAPTFTTLGALAEVDVGIVTGCNEFFVVTPEEAERWGVSSRCLPLVGKSAQIPGLRLSEASWKALSEGDGRCLLVNLQNVERHELDKQALAYVERGEGLGFHKGYKCRVRLPRWWVVPSMWVPDAFLLRQIYDAPRIVVNTARATCTDTIHRMRMRPGVRASAVAATSINSLTAAFAEIRGRSYGGGVLELEPSEAESLPFPRPAALDLTELDRMFSTKGLRALMEEVDRRVLSEQGISRAEIALLQQIWSKLSMRRLARTRKEPIHATEAPVITPHAGEDPYSEQHTLPLLVPRIALAEAATRV